MLDVRLPSRAATGAGDEAAVFDSPNINGDCVVAESPKGLFVVVVANKLGTAGTLGLELKSPLYDGFVFALASPEDFEFGVTKIFPLDEGVPNNPLVGFVLAVPKLEAPQLNVTGSGFVLAGLGAGVPSF